jgi:hypothetical protein
MEMPAYSRMVGKSEVIAQTPIPKSSVRMARDPGVIHSMTSPTCRVA